MQKLQQELSKIIDYALIEDGALLDATSDLAFEDKKIVKFNIIAKKDIIFCGNDVINLVFDKLCRKNKFAGSEFSVEQKFSDGDFIKSGQIIANGRGEAKLILAGERVLLNIIQHLSGIATMTNNFIKKLNNNKIKILDTRKTLPNIRLLQKYAVTKGGGVNHRFNLSDMIMIKDNHVAIAGSIENAIKSCRKNKKLKIEVECDNKQQVISAIASNPDIIMLDNMSISDIVQCAQLIRSHSKEIKIEVSGGINIDNISDYSDLDIDFISIGYLTHSAIASDISLECII